MVADMSASTLLRSLAIIVDVEAFGTCPLSLLRNANSSVRYVREKMRYIWSSSLLAVYRMRDKEEAVNMHFTHHTIFSGQSSSVTLLTSPYGLCLSACVKSADMENDCLAFQHTYALIVLS
jgi:hypothetical protein